MLKILLIDANSGWLVKRDNLVDLEMITLPIGLMYIATYLKNKFGTYINVKIFDEIAQSKSKENLLHVLSHYEPDVVGIRGLSIFEQEFHAAAAVVKGFKNKIIIIGGGPYVTCDLKNAIKDSNIDYFIIGEGEITLGEMIEKLLDNQDLRGIKGIAYRENSMVNYQPRPFIKILNKLPFPDYSFISSKTYAKFINYAYNRRKYAGIFSSRGCPYGCVYCHSIFGKEFRARSPENVLQEITSLYKEFNIKDFFIFDDNFNFNYDRAIKIFDLIIKCDIKINIYLIDSIRGDIVDTYFIDKMVKAGVIWVDYSVETASPRLQKLIRKNIDLEKIAKNIHYTCKKNIMVGIFIMVGFPSETENEAYSTIEYLKQFKKIAAPKIASVKFYPKTEIYDLALKYGAKISDLQNTHTTAFHNFNSFKTSLISEIAARNIFLKFVNEIFFSEERLLNAIKIQKMFLTKQEILDFYSAHFKRRASDLEKDVLRYIKKTQK